MVLRIGVLTTAFLIAAVPAMPAQIRAGSSLGTQRVNNAPRLLVANPIPASSQDSALAVQLGSELRSKMERVVGRDYQILTREQMNEALVSYGYPQDALLPPFEANRLIRAVNGTLYITSTMNRANGQIRLSLRFTSTRSGDGAGYMATTTQESGESIDRLTQRAAESLRGAIRAYPDAKACVDQAATDRSKAAAAAQKALRAVPNYGLAEFCLAALAAVDDPVGETALTHYRNALSTDSMSIPSYSGIAQIYFSRGDTARTVETWQQVLRVEPRNQVLRDQAFELFRQFGRQEAAEEVADEGIRIDPNNVDWYDLKSNSCLAQEKFDCAVHELERAFNVDSTRADSAFFRKITLAAQFVTDTSKYVQWAVKGAERYPDDVVLAKNAARAHSYTGNMAALKESIRKLQVMDPSDTEPLVYLVVAASKLPAGEAKIAGGRELFEFLPLVRNSDDETLKSQYGQTFVGIASEAYGAQNIDVSAQFADSALATGMTDPGLKGFAGFFAAFPLMNRYATLANEVRQAGPSCAKVDEFQSVVTRLLDLSRLAQQAPNADIQNAAAQYVNGLPGELEVANTLRRSCR